MYFSELNRAYTRRPILLAVRGTLMLVFGLSMFIHPQTASRLLVYVLAGGLLFDGLVLVVPALLNRVNHRLKKIVLVKGGLEIIVALLAVTHYLYTLRALAVLFSLLIIFRGVLRFITFVELDTPVRFQRMILLQAIVMMMIGVLLLLHPFGGKTAFVLFVGLYSMTEGIDLLQKAWRRNDEIDHPVVLPPAEHETTIVGEMS